MVTRYTVVQDGQVYEPFMLEVLEAVQIISKR